MIPQAGKSSPGQAHVRLKRHIRSIKPCQDGTGGPDGSTVFSNSNALFPFKKQGPQPLYPTLATAFPELQSSQISHRFLHWQDRARYRSYSCEISVSVVRIESCEISQEWS